MQLGLILGVSCSLSIGNTKKQHTFGKNINDGRNHQVTISVNKTQVDNTSYPGLSLSSSISLQLSYLGGLKDWGLVSPSVVIATIGVRGCLQDARLNDKKFDFSGALADSFPLADSKGLGKIIYTLVLLLVRRLAD